MPRRQRLWEPGVILSVVVRAHEGRPVFATDEDRQFLVGHLARVLARGFAELLAWAILLNRFHLLLRITDRPPEGLFRRVNTAIGIRERRRRGDHGAVLQGRYWSRPCTSDDVPGEAMASLLDVSGVAVSRARRRGADLLAAQGWSIDDVLSWRAPDL